MGKIRVKTLGIEEQEKEQKKEAKKRQEKKKLVKVPGLKGGERVVAVGPSEEELATTETVSSKTVVTKKSAVAKKRSRSRKYQEVAQLVEKNKLYPIGEALSLLPKLKTACFDETVELHINATEKLTGQATLPHGTGKKTRVAIADEKLIAEIEKGKVDFDVLLSTPDMMPKLAKVAKFLGPRGLMPSPKNGTITQKPEETAKKYEGGQISFKTESKTPIIHLSLGKVSFGEKKLMENIEVLFRALPKTKIRNAILKSTMSPGIKLDVSTLP